VVIQAPPDILLSSLWGAITPPGISPRLLAEPSECIDVAYRDELVHPGTLFGQISSIAFVLLRSGQIDRFMGYIKITRNYNMLAF
jgi:hypothetical protein